MPLPFQNKDDKDLLHCYYADGNNEWLGILLQRYTGLLLGVCMQYLKNEEDAKDAVQQIFLKVINELQKYKVDYFKSWLYMVAKNHCLMKLRGKHHKTFELKETVAEADDMLDKKDAIIQNNNTLTHLENALQLLNEEQRICVTLFYLQKKSYTDITIETNYTLLQVKSHIQNGKRNLKIQMERLDKNEH